MGLHSPTAEPSHKGRRVRTDSWGALTSHVARAVSTLPAAKPWAAAGQHSLLACWVAATPSMVSNSSSAPRGGCPPRSTALSCQ